MELYFDYTRQAWVRDGKYVSCEHPSEMNCGCFGRTHAGEDAQGLTYAQFEKAYETLLRKLISADWNSIDRRNYIREVADLVDTYPAFEARYDAEIETR